MSEILPHKRFGSELPTLVLLHFFAGSQHEWKYVVDLLSPRYECITMDLPGFGDAAAIAGYSVAEMMASVGTTTTALALNDYILVGHSLSGKVALALAAEGLPGLRALILVTPSPPEPEPIDDGNRNKMLGFDRNCKDGEAYLDAITSRPLTGQTRQSALEDFLRCSQDAWEAWLNKGSKEDWAKRVGVVECISIVITGETDPSLSTSVQAELTLPHLSNGYIEEIRDCGHLPMLEKPEELAVIISNFVEQTITTLNSSRSKEHAGD